MILVRMTPSQYQDLHIINQYIAPDQWSWVSSNVLGIDIDHEQSPELLSLFKAIIRENFHNITLLMTYRANDFSVYLLNLLHQTSPGKIYDLVDGLIVSMSLHNEELLAKAQSVYASFPAELMDVVVCYCRHQGSLKACAQELYLHRNTVNQKIQAFIAQTGINIRLASFQLFIRVLNTLLYGQK